MNDKVAVVGLGYVGLPLALAFGKKFKTIAFDISKKRIDTLDNRIDFNGDVSSEEFAKSRFISFSNDPNSLLSADYIIIAVPTPVDKSNTPDLKILLSACKIVAQNLKNGATIIFESTVYPGATEEECVLEIEKHSGKVWKKDFFVGYSPERINPGDKVHTLENIVKVVSGDSTRTLEKVSKLYSSIINAGVFEASSIKVAEAAKVIENTQRDINIALINELSKIFHLMNISTYEVLEAASTKWNFLKFQPGLVGGHCIGVDPYYLTHKAQTLGHNPEVILAGRRINDDMGKYVARELIKVLLKNKISDGRISVNILGMCFKENVTDIRNSKVIDLVREFIEFGIGVNVYDHLANKEDVQMEYGIELSEPTNIIKADCLILAVPHERYINFSFEDISRYVKHNGLVGDLKAVWKKNFESLGNYYYWTL